MIKILSRRALVLMYISAATLGLMLLSTTIEYRKKHEPDPLTVIPPESQDVFTGLTASDLFTFQRKVCTTKDLIVRVHREFANDAGDLLYQLPSVAYGAYAENGCIDVIFTGVIPNEIPAGWYEYRPILIYDVNEVLQIAKPAPRVRVEVVE
jgi:hypothetical protein